MSDSVSPAAADRPAKRPRAWWQWVLGVGLLAVAGGSLLLRAFPNLHSAIFGNVAMVRQFEIKPPDALEKADALPAKPGDLAGCNVLLVTTDTTRADRIGCYGNDVVRTPALDQMAQEGVLFSDVTAAAPVTLPSHSSILTGLYPYHHGARANNLFKLEDKNVTLAEVLRDAGYKTAAFISAFVINGRFGMAQGFEFFDDHLESDQNELWLEVAERTGDKTADSAIDWLKNHGKDGKFFAWVHFYDPHYPYQAPEAYEKAVPIVYDAEISFMDAQLQRLLNELDELGIADNTLVVVVGDHGEGLNHHGEGAHGMLVYDTVMRVPMIMKCGDRLGSGVHVSQPASHVDVMPTVLSLLGVEAPPGVDGHDLTQPSAPDRPIFFETLEGLAEHGCAACIGVRTGPLKYIYGYKPELYDLSNDPFEKSDLATSKKDVADKMHKTLKSFFGDDLESATTPETTEALTEEEKRLVEALGYAGSSGGAIVPAEERTDPRETLEILRLVTPAVSKGLENGLPELEKIAAQYPNSYIVQLYRGQGYQKVGKLDQAEAAFDRAHELRPSQPQPLLGLAQIKARQNKLVEAEGLYKIVLKRLPGSTGVLSEYSQVLAGMGRFTDAAELLQQAFETNPTDELVPDRLYRLKSRAGLRDEVVALFEEYLAENPNLAMVRIALSAHKVGKQEYAAGIEMLREGLRIDPENQMLINNLAYVLATCPDNEYRLPYEATNLMETLCQKTGYSDPRFLHTLGLVYFTQQRADEAITITEKAVEIASESKDPAIKWYLPSIKNSLKAFKDAKASGMAPMVAPTTMPAAANETDDATGTENAAEADDAGPTSASP